MKTSAFEIRSTLQKAALGCGLETGLAIDVGLAAEWLSLHSLDGVSAALAAIGSLTQPAPDQTANNGVVLVEKTPVARCGASVMDILAAEQNIKQMQLNHANSPLLMLGIAGIYARTYQMDITLTFSGGARASLHRGTLRTNSDQIPMSGDVLIKRGKSDTKLTLVQPLEGSLTTDDHAWQKATRLAARIYVPETELSRTKGAGAGMTDND